MAKTIGAQPGNDNAHKGAEWHHALKRAMARKVKSTTFRDGLDKVADVVVAQAIDDGDRTAWQEIGNRMDGKPGQAVVITGDPDKPIGIMPFEFIAPNSEDT